MGALLTGLDVLQGEGAIRGLVRGVEITGKDDPTVLPAESPREDLLGLNANQVFLDLGALGAALVGVPKGLWGVEVGIDGQEELPGPLGLHVEQEELDGLVESLFPDIAGKVKVPLPEEAQVGAPSSKQPPVEIQDVNQIRVGPVTQNPGAEQAMIHLVPAGDGDPTQIRSRYSPMGQRTAAKSTRKNPLEKPWRPRKQES